MTDQIREIILDTETTGLDPKSGHKIVEIGCLELINHIPTGKFYHQYINPERQVPYEAARIHGLTTEKLRPYPIFKKVAQEFLNFIQDSTLVIHNAPFDMGFLNFELQSVGLTALSFDRVIDTVIMARRKFPGAPANLDALCKRFKVNNAHRKFHGALLDSELLAEVYVELLGGRQQGLMLSETQDQVDQKVQESQDQDHSSLVQVKISKRESRGFCPSEEEMRLHQEMISHIKGSLWQ